MKYIKNRHLCLSQRFAPNVKVLSWSPHHILFRKAAILSQESRYFRKDFWNNDEAEEESSSGLACTWLKNRYAFLSALYQTVKSVFTFSASHSIRKIAIYSFQEPGRFLKQCRSGRRASKRTSVYIKISKAVWAISLKKNSPLKYGDYARKLKWNSRDEHLKYTSKNN